VVLVVELLLRPLNLKKLRHKNKEKTFEETALQTILIQVTLFNIITDLVLYK